MPIFEDKYSRKMQTAVTNFLVCGNDYLFLHRNKNKRVDPGRLNAVGGRLEPGEDFLAAAIRETAEETGYIVKQKDITLAGVVKLEGGYQEDWIMCYFKISVKDKKIPRGTMTEDGKLMWLQKDAVLKSQIELVDDLQYCFKEIIEGREIFFMTAQMDDRQKITAVSINMIPR